MAATIRLDPPTVPPNRAPDVYLSGIAPGQRIRLFIDGAKNSRAMVWGLRDGTATTSIPVTTVLGAHTVVGKADNDAVVVIGAYQVAVPIPPQPPIQSVVVGSISELYAALADTANREIILKDGTYPTTWMDISGARAGYIRSAQTAVLVRAATSGGVTFDLGGTSSVSALFRSGVAYQTWQGFRYGNSHPVDNGVIQFGQGDRRPVHHITLRDIEFLDTITQPAGPGGDYNNGHGLYFTDTDTAQGGNHDILIDGYVCRASLAGAIHAYHDADGDVGHDITVKRMTVYQGKTYPGTRYGLFLASTTFRDVLFEDVTVYGAADYGLYQYGYPSTRVTIRRMTTTGSKAAGRYSENITPPFSGITFDSCSWG